jgi:hypothetical protein
MMYDRMVGWIRGTAVKIGVLLLGVACFAFVNCLAYVLVHFAVKYW